MYKIIFIVIASIALLTSCGSNSSNLDSNKNDIDIRDKVISKCDDTVSELRAENEKLKSDIVEKDKKIVWLRGKAKAAGADLTK